MPDVLPSVAGDDSFGLGMNGYIHPSKLMPGQYEMGMNVISRGGIAQTRPGSRSMVDVPAGAIQGMTYFKPTNGVACLVFAIAGSVYVAPSPFSTYYQLTGLQFSPYTKFISWTTCMKSTDYNIEGVLYYLDNPYAVLMIQDGSTRAGYWDGSDHGHINPTPSGSELTSPGFDGTPIGLWSVWSGNRLWVSRENQVFASDIGNPMKFTESQYLNEGRAFYLPGECTGMAETTDRQGIICFTEESGTFLRSSIQDRTLWLSTPSFQDTILPNIGCVSARSIVQQYGLLWWFTAKGLVNQNDALKINISSRLDIQDNEMIQSKANLSYDLSGVAGSYIENFLFHAVPNGDKRNTRLHVLDQAPFDDMTNSWPSYWTGWRPVEFARGVISGQERVFCISSDYDDVNRIWELFSNDKTDNGIPITSFVVTKEHLFDNRDYKRFRYAEIEIASLSGPTALMVGAAGLRGSFQPVMVKDLSALNGQVYFDVQYGFEANDIMGSRVQTRIVKTQDSSPPSECNAECVESDIRGLIDKGFSILIAWSGIMGISAYRIFSTSEPRAYQGTCEDDETDEDRLITTDGCGAFERLSVLEPFTQYFATATFSRVSQETGLVVTHTSTQASMISQVDANRKASRTAEWYVLSEIGEL